jgi:glycosyltransferase involved in cell wall biosynthesis
MTPKVSVTIPTYNRVSYLSQAIESVLAQSFSDFELIVCDNASTDATPLLVEQYADSRIRYVRHSGNLGMADNWRAALATAAGQYVAFLGDDDWWSPDFLARLTPPLERYPEVDVSFADHWIVDHDGAFLHDATERSSRVHGRMELAPGLHRPFLRPALRDQALLPTASLFRRLRLGAIEAIRPTAETTPAYLIYGKLAMSGGGAYYVPERLAAYRVHAASATATHPLRAWREFQWACAQLSEEFGPDNPGAPLVRDSWLAAIGHEGSLLLRAGALRPAREAYLRAVRMSPRRPLGWAGLVATLPGAYRIYRSLRDGAHPRGRSS